MAMIKVSALPWAWQAPPVRLVLQAPRPPGPRGLLWHLRSDRSAKLLCLFLPPRPVSSFETLSHVGQGHSKGLHGREGVLEVQDVRIAVNPSELHHLGRRGKQRR